MNQCFWNQSQMNTSHSFLRRALKPCALVLGSFWLSACGTTFQIPPISADATDTATKMFAQEASTTDSDRQIVSERSATKRYNRVITRVEPVAEAFCRRHMEERRPDYNCDVEILVDTEMKVRNAYQTRTRDGTPIIACSVPMLIDARNDDEIAFILGHEYGHHIATHLEKAEQQAVAGALIMGTLMAAAQVYASSYDPYRYTGNDSQDLQNMMGLGYAVGDKAFSQTYELESDVVATHIARAAGYDPVKGARFFARPEDVKTETGKLSFWGTHPPDEKRLALVIQTNAEIDNEQTLEER